MTSLFGGEDAEAVEVDPGYRELHELFEAGRRLRGAERQRFLEERCPEGSPRRAELEGLLAGEDGEEDALFSESQLLQVRHQVEGLLSPTAGSPEQIGPYRIVRRLGAGGMGIVFEAEASDPYRVVAVKVLRTGLYDERARLRFAMEHQALALIQHPNVATFYDSGTSEDGTAYVAMEFVDGAPLTTYADEQRLGLRARLELMLDVCAAVSHVHDQGILHRDLKPSNILVRVGGDRPLAKVIDFGIAKFTGDGGVELPSQTLTAMGAAMGTPDYMSPEQAGATDAAIDARTDVYALGAVLYELLCGLTPLPVTERRTSSLAETLRIIREHEVPRPTVRLSDSAAAEAIAEARGLRRAELVQELRSELEWIPLQALRKAPEERYGSVRELADDIQRYLRLEPLRAGPESLGYRARKAFARNRMLVSLVALIVVSLVVAVIGTSVGMRRAQQSATEAQRAQEDEARARAEADTSRKEAEWGAYQANMVAANAALSLSDPATAWDRLGACPEHLRGWEWHALLRECDHSERVLTRNSSGCSAVAIDSRSRWVAMRDGSGTSIVWDIETGETVFEGSEPNDGHGELSFVDDDRGLYVDRARNPHRRWNLVDGTLDLEPEPPPELPRRWTYDARRRRFENGETGELVPLPSTEHVRELGVPRYAQDGRLLLSSNPAVFLAYEVPSGRCLLRVPQDIQSSDVFRHRFPVKELLYPDGQRVLLPVRNTAEIHHLETGAQLAVIPMEDQMVGWWSLVDEGRHLVTVSRPGVIRLYDLENRRSVLARHGHREPILSTAFSADGRWLATGSQDGTVRLWRLDRREGPSLGGTLEPFHFSPDGGRLYGSKGGVADVAARRWRSESREGAADEEGSYDRRTRPGWLRFRGLGEEAPRWELSIPPEWGPLLCFDRDRRDRQAVIVAQDQVHLVSIPDGQEISSFPTPARSFAVRMNPDGSSFVIREKDAHGEATFHPVQEGGEPFVLRSEEENEGFLVRYSPDGRLLFTSGYDRSVRVWDGRTGVQVGTLVGHRPGGVLTLNFDAEGRRAITACQDGSARSWDLETLEPLRLYGPHPVPVQSAVFHPDGTRVATASHDGSIRIYHVDRSRPILTLLRHPTPAHQVLFSPDGRMLVSRAESECRIWERD